MIEHQQNRASAQIIEQFFQAIAAKDIGAMDAKYHEAVSFSSPLYPDLRKERVVNAWAYMLDQFDTITIEPKVLFADDRKAQASWDLTYTCDRRKVSLSGISTFSLWDDQIVRHVDEWKFSSWTRQHCGLKGLIFSWLPMFEQRCKDYAVEAITLGAQSRR